MAGIREILRDIGEDYPSPIYKPAKQDTEPVSLNHLDKIKHHIRSMPYGDFIEMMNAISADATKMWAWATGIA